MAISCPFLCCKSVRVQAMSPVNGERYCRDGEKAIKRESSPSPCNDVSSRGSAASSSGKHKVIGCFVILLVVCIMYAVLDGDALHVDNRAASLHCSVSELYRK